MIRNLKVLGLAIAALSAVSASGASAAEFRSEVASTYVHSATENNSFTVNSRSVKCKEATVSGEASGTATPEIAVTPHHTECTAFGLSIGVKMNGCYFLVTVLSATSGSIHIKCPAGQQIEAIGSNCTLKIAEQTPEGSVNFANQGSGSSRDIALSSSLNLMTNVSGSLLICGQNGLRPSTYIGEFTVKGYTNSTKSTQVGIWVE